MILSVDNMYSGYGDSTILNDVSITVDKSETVCVLGPNGAGKSTLLKAIMGIARVRSGKVLFQGQEITNFPPRDLLRLGIAYANVGRGVIPAMTVEENLKMGAYVFKDKNRIASNMERVYNLFPVLKSYKNQRSGLLSGGEQQMLALGAALVLDPKIILLDEPSVGLAPKFQDMIFQRIQDLKSTGVSILLVEQNVFKALEVSDRGYVLEMGAVKFQGKSQDIMNGEKLSDLYLGGS